MSSIKLEKSEFMKDKCKLLARQISADYYKMGDSRSLVDRQKKMEMQCLEHYPGENKFEEVFLSHHSENYEPEHERSTNQYGTIKSGNWNSLYKESEK